MTTRAETWLRALVLPEECAHSLRKHGVLYCDAKLEGRPVRYIAVVPDPANPFPRARRGEAGLLQGWVLAEVIREMMGADTGGVSRGIVALVDVPSQAYGRTEEALGISLALAAAVDAYARARMSGHPSVTLILGKAFSGALLAHGYQASRILALDSASVQIQAMGRAAAMRVMRRTEQELDKAAFDVPPMAYNLTGFCKLEILHATIPCSDPDTPSHEDVIVAQQALGNAMEMARLDGAYLAPRLHGHATESYRDASREVRKKMQQSWTIDVPEESS